MKKIWIIAPFTNVGVEGDGSRFEYIADNLALRGRRVKVYTSSFCHREKKQKDELDRISYRYEAEYVREPGYRKNVSLKRAVSHIRYAWNLRKKMEEEEKPELIYCAYPTMCGAYVAGRFARKHGIPFVLDVQDTWPESISAALNTDKVLIRTLMYPFTLFANKIYSMGDIVIAVSNTYLKRAMKAKRRGQKFLPVYLGTDVTTADGIEPYIRRGRETDEIWVTYIGTLGHSYDIETAIRAFGRLREKSRIKLKIIGEGPDLERLRKLSVELGVEGKNVRIYGYMNYREMFAILKSSDIALNALTAESKGTITNKLGDYLSAGLPILNSCAEEEVLDLIKYYKVGRNYRAGDPDDLAGAVVEMAENTGRAETWGKNARALAEIRFDRGKSYKKIYRLIDKLTE